MTSKAFYEAVIATPSISSEAKEYARKSLMIYTYSSLEGLIRGAIALNYKCRATPKQIAQRLKLSEKIVKENLDKMNLRHTGDYYFLGQCDPLNFAALREDI